VVRLIGTPEAKAAAGQCAVQQEQWHQQRRLQLKQHKEEMALQKKVLGAVCL